MNTAPEEFGQLRRLLALKRHEQPPPRYFNEFSGKVIARLETAPSATSRSWLERLMQVFELKPMLTGAFGITAFGLLLIGLVSFERPEDAAVTTNPVVAESSMVSVASAEGGINQFAIGGSLQSSIDPALNTQPASALFNGFHLNVQPVAFNSRGN